MELLEREAEIAVFEAALADAARGAGSVLLVLGEAGIGKTSLVRELARRADGTARVLVGACDHLLTPRTLGPLRDLPLGEDAPLRRALAHESDRDAILSAVQDELTDPLRPTVVVIEDAHWADEATRDVLAFLGRRVAGMPTVLVVTYRDELAPDHSLRAVLGGLTGPAVRRLPLRPLSSAALARLAAGGTIAPDRLRALTGGNPFLVAETLAAADLTSVPLPVQDAVAARLQGLADDARDVLGLLAVAPGGLELDLLTTLVPTAIDAVAAVERVALVELVDGRARFRHELLRTAVEATATTATLTHAHARILAALERDQPPDPSRAAHHAVGSADVAAMLEYGPAAARRAAEVGSHRDAIVLLEAALRHEDQLEPGRLADLLRWYAFELYLANRHGDAMRAAQRAVVLLREEGGATLGKALTLLSHVSCWAAQPQVSREAATRSIEVLDADGPTAALAMAYANLAFVLAMQGDLGASATSAARGLELADELGLSPVRPYALVQLGAARSLGGDPAGEDLLVEGLAVAQQVGRHEYVPLACT